MGTSARGHVLGSRAFPEISQPHPGAWGSVYTLELAHSSPEWLGPQGAAPPSTRDHVPRRFRPWGTPVTQAPMQRPGCAVRGRGALGEPRRGRLAWGAEGEPSLTPSLQHASCGGRN